MDNRGFSEIYVWICYGLGPGINTSVQLFILKKKIFVFNKAIFIRCLSFFRAFRGFDACSTIY